MVVNPCGDQHSSPHKMLFKKPYSLLSSYVFLLCYLSNPSMRSKNTAAIAIINNTEELRILNCQMIMMGNFLYYQRYSVFADELDDAEAIENIKSPFSKVPTTITNYDIRHDVDYPSD